jgi:hypothetical protein
MYSISSPTVFAGTDGCVNRKYENVPTLVIGVNALTGS